MLTEPDAIYLWPDEGSVYGGTEMSIAGYPRRATTTLLDHPILRLNVCRLGLQHIGAQARTDSQSIQCLTQAFTAGFVVVSLSSNAADYTMGPVFQFRQAAIIDSLLPRMGSDYGGGIVHVIGRELLHSGMRCMFGAHVLFGQRISSFLFLCTSPHAPEGLTHVELVSRSLITVGSSSADSRMPFFVFIPPEVTAITPTSGNPDGGTLVTVLGAHYINSVDLSCAFGPVCAVAAAWVEHSEAQCVSPARVHGSPVIRIGNNGVQFENAADPGEATFSYVGEIGVMTSMSIDAIIAGYSASGGAATSGSTSGGL